MEISLGGRPAAKIVPLPGNDVAVQKQGAKTFRLQIFLKAGEIKIARLVFFLFVDKPGLGHTVEFFAANPSEIFTLAEFKIKDNPRPSQAKPQRPADAGDAKK